MYVYDFCLCCLARNASFVRWRLKIQVIICMYALFVMKVARILILIHLTRTIIFARSRFIKNEIYMYVRGVWLYFGTHYYTKERGNLNVCAICYWSGLSSIFLFYLKRIICSVTRSMYVVYACMRLLVSSSFDNAYNLRTVYGPRSAFTIFTNCTDCKTVSPSCSWTGDALKYSVAHYEL